MESGKNTDIKNELYKPGNRICAECYDKDPRYASLSVGVFICEACAKFHRLLGERLNNVVEIHRHKWSDTELGFLAGIGNEHANGEWERDLPMFYHRPTSDDPKILREQWIRAKYEREEFKNKSQQSSYNQGSKTGALFKRAKDNHRFQRRKFILKETEGCLQYFIKYSDKTPKDVIPIKDIVNIYMVPEKVGNVNGMQLTYERSGSRRNIYLYGDDGKTTSDWYHSIRAAMVKHKYKTFPMNEAQRYLNTWIKKEGWMSKTGPRNKEKFRQRWFCLVGTIIWYYTEPLDSNPLGFIGLGSKTFGYSIMRGFPRHIAVDGYGITIHTPDRVYALICSDMDSRNEWCSVIDEVLETCTGVWAQPNIGRLGSNKPSQPLQHTGGNKDVAGEPSSTPSPKKVSSSVESLTDVKPRNSKKQGSPSTKSSTEVKHEPATKIRTHDSKLYSDDSDDMNILRSLSTISDSEEDIVVFVQPEPKSTPKKPPRRNQPIGKELVTSSNPGSSENMASLDVFSNEESPWSSPQYDVGLTPPPNEEWRKKTFSSIRRVAGHERNSIKQTSLVRNASVASTSSQSDVKEVTQRPVDVTLTNQMDESLWFMVFQSEEDHDNPDSFVTPWIGAQIAEEPASVGPIRVPQEFEIAIIDTAPGGFKLQRTTGPFFAQMGDVWEVEISDDNGSAPEMFFHEGMETEDGSVMVYSNVGNAKRFDVAVFKSGRKLLTRRGVKPGDSVGIKVQQALHFIAVDSETYYNLENEDLRSVDYIPKASTINLISKMSKLKVKAKKRGKTVYFTCDRPKSVRS